MADRISRITGSQIKDLTITDAELAANSVTTAKILDANVTTAKILDANVTAAKIADGVVSEVKLDVNTAAGVGVDGYVLYWNNTAGKLDYKSVPASLDTAVLESDIAFNEIPSGLINSLNAIYTLAVAPEANSVCVFLNGLLQQAGAGKDYTISGSTITFVTAPDTGDVLLVNSIKAS